MPAAPTQRAAVPPGRRPVPTPSAKQSAWIAAAMLGMIAIPAAITLHSVSHPVRLEPTAANPSPYGYTWSLLLFIVPIVAIFFWFVPGEQIRIPKLAFWRTIGVLAPLGCALDFFFANSLFVYPNRQATLGIGAPALGGPVPVEEYVFYLTGFIAVLLIYVWLSEYWLAAYNTESYVGDAKALHRLIQFHPASAVLGILLIVAAVLFKKLASPVPAGWPWYWIVLVAGGFVPSITFFPTARPYINWRAFSLTVFFIVLVSLVWEATLAVPYGWWGYQPRPMMGVFIGAWAGLPLEAVCVWIAVAYGTVIVFEIVKLWKASGKPARQAFTGKPVSGTTA
jgi:hypothetical protein